ncbi:MAG: 3'-5' exonuclease [Candidatus Binatia bacterium]
MSFLVFDIETRVDKALLAATLYRSEGLSPEDAYDRMRETLRRETDGRSDFIPHTFHVPISIALGYAASDYVLQRLDVLGADELGEAGLVRTFWERLEKFDGTLVSFNARGFDLPVLELQGLRHRCQAPRYFGERSGIRQRFGRHCDLYDFLTNTGAARLRGGFDLVAKLVGLPGKGAVSGADVQGLYESGGWAAIHRYCADDVLQTYFLFLRIELLRGKLSPARLDEIEAAAAVFRQQIGSPA